ncbi:aspartate carbamoyltransferase [bacterium]|nr:aspartate carbamoyltransferase [bacterium]|tara:strand:+ start:29589 stop:30524 length:936 start_codon:yes stop_codon:yes gene_type:complete
MGNYPSPYTHTILSQQFTPEFLKEVFELADKIRANPKEYQDALRGKVVATLFYEPSTRTRLSFESAIAKLGGAVISTENAREASSASKGETIEDTIRIISMYADMIVMRHYEDDASLKALATVSVPLINAGSGRSQHPTQALLDVYTIWRERGTVEDLEISVVGDLLNGRTCDSLVYVLAKFPGNTFNFVAPDNCSLKEGLKEHLEENKVEFKEHKAIEDIIETTDVLYMTRVQKERFGDEKEYEKAAGQYILTKGLVERMKKDAIILHPLPRVDEIAVEADLDSRAKYFEQAQNGLWVRMALLVILARRN